MTEPARYPPVSILRLFLKMGGWFVIAFTLVLLVITLIGQLSFNTAKRFEKEGRFTIATVIEKYYTESVDSDGDRTVTYWLVLNYVTQRREEITHARSVGSGFYNGVKAGEEIELHYLESDPTVTEVREGSYAEGARIAQVIALVLGLLWLAGLWVTGRWTVEAVRARRYGASETAEVTEIYRTAVRVNNRPRYRLMWKDSQGRPGKSLLRKAQDLKDFRAGDEIRIYQGLKRPWWAGDIGDPPN